MMSKHKIHFVKPFGPGDVVCKRVVYDCTTISQEVTCKRCLKWLAAQEETPA